MSRLSGKSGSVVVGTSSIAGINKWVLETGTDALRTSGFDSGGHHDSGIGIDGWKGSFSGFKDGAPLVIGNSVILTLKESQTNTDRVYQGTAFIMASKHEVAYEGVIQYAYDFQGTGLLAESTAFYYASDSLLLSSDGTVSTYSLTYEKLKELTSLYKGQLRIKFQLSVPNAGITGYAQIYRNGVAVGTERTVVGASFNDFSEDISGWESGDLIQLYGKTSDASYRADVLNFRVYGSVY